MKAQQQPLPLVLTVVMPVSAGHVLMHAPPSQTSHSALEFPSSCRHTKWSYLLGSTPSWVMASVHQSLRQHSGAQHSTTQHNRVQHSASASHEEWINSKNNNVIAYTGMPIDHQMLKHRALKRTCNAVFGQCKPYTRLGWSKHPYYTRRQSQHQSMQWPH